MALNNLYPPIIDTYMPAFVVEKDGGEEVDNKGVKISFTLSSFNSLAEIETVWISVTNQYTNETVLSNPNGVQYISINDVGQNKNNEYYLYIKGADLVEKWRVGEHYKVQLRFCKTTPPQDEGTKISDWIVQNSDSFSEWSKVCLLTPILKPSISLTGLDEEKETVLSSMSNIIAGTFKTDDKETLDSYSIQIFNRNDLNIPLYNSGIIYTNASNPNEINYTLLYGFLEGVRYILRFTYTTENLYSQSIDYSFMILNTSVNTINADIVATPINEKGCIEIKISSQNEVMFGNLVIRRTSHLSDFIIWEDVQNITLTDTAKLNLVWEDYTAESGVLYKYCVQKIDSAGNRGVAVRTVDPVIIYLEDMFLVGDNRALRLKFNPQISSYSQIVSEASVQTIGSKYPFIKRNSVVQYKQFSISGLISHFMDEDDIFINKDILYNGHKQYYDDYNYTHSITLHNDLTLERKFREQVEQFLYDGKVKLFKSPTEGNILVRLMNISLTPETILGRMVYTFSATAYEIGDATLINYNKYNIQSIGEYKQATQTVSKTQRLTLTNGEDKSKTTLKQLLQQFEGIADTDEKKHTVTSIDSLKIQFEGNPYIVENEGTYLGYAMTLDNQDLIINSKGYYQVEANITDCSFSIPTTNHSVLVECSYTVTETENIANDVGFIRYYMGAGQVADVFVYEDDIITDYILSKYDYKEGKSYEKLYSIPSITIETEPNSMIRYRDTSSDEIYDIKIGDTGTLHLEGLDYEINGLWIDGYAIIDYIYELEKGEYINEK